MKKLTNNVRDSLSRPLRSGIKNSLMTGATDKVGLMTVLDSKSLNRPLNLGLNFTQFFVQQMDDDTVCDKINFDYGIKMYDVDSAIRSRNIPLTTCRPYANGNHPCTNRTDCKGHWYMPQMRDLLVQLLIFGNYK